MLGVVGCRVQAQASLLYSGSWGNVLSVGRFFSCLHGRWCRRARGGPAIAQVVKMPTKHVSVLSAIAGITCYTMLQPIVFLLLQPHDKIPRLHSCSTTDKRHEFLKLYYS